MGLQLPQRASAPVKRVAMAAVLASSVLLLGACSAEDKHQIKNFAMPDPITEQAPHTFELWKWAWVAALAVGVLVWGLIGYAVVRFRRRSADEIPVQTRYNLPLEIFYTIAPVLMVIVFFNHTVSTQNKILAEVDNPDYTIEVTAQQWSWTFNYPIGETNPDPNPNPRDKDVSFRSSEYAWENGDGSNIPTLYLPINKTVHFNLFSPDVIHSFGVPNFLTKLDVIPGRVNHFQVTPNKLGTYPGKCFELCGTYHSRMLFNVKIVSQQDYDAYVQTLEDAGQTSDLPLIGGLEVYTQTGLKDSTEGGHE